MGYHERVREYQVARKRAVDAVFWGLPGHFIGMIFAFFVAVGILWAHTDPGWGLQAGITRALYYAIIIELAIAVLVNRWVHADEVRAAKVAARALKDARRSYKANAG